MAHVPPYKLDPYVVIRNPDLVPVLFRRGMYDIIEKETTGSLYTKMLKAFNFIATSLTESGRLIKGTLNLTPLGFKREVQVQHERDSRLKVRWINVWAKQLRTKEPRRYQISWWDERKQRTTTEVGGK